MILIDAPRYFFQLLTQNAVYAEVGVYKGAYTHGVLAQEPKKVYLIDPWTAPDISILIPQDYVGDPKQSLREAFEGSGYYQGGLEVALNEAYNHIQTSYGQDPKVTILKMKSSEVCDTFADGSIDFLYLDGNHRYDFVLADLERWAPKISLNGVIVLNDCYVSPIGKKQHVSVVEALTTFLKLSDFRPVAMVQEPFGDVVITRQDNQKFIHQKIINALLFTDYKFILMPDQLLANMQHKKVEYIHDGTSLFKEVLSFD